MAALVAVVVVAAFTASVASIVAVVVADILETVADSVDVVASITVLIALVVVIVASPSVCVCKPWDDGGWGSNGPNTNFLMLTVRSVRQLFKSGARQNSCRVNLVHHVTTMRTPHSFGGRQKRGRGYHSKISLPGAITT